MEKARGPFIQTPWVQSARYTPWENHWREREWYRISWYGEILLGGMSLITEEQNTESMGSWLCRAPWRTPGLKKDVVSGSDGRLCHLH